MLLKGPRTQLESSHLLIIWRPLGCEGGNKTVGIRSVSPSRSVDFDACCVGAALSATVRSLQDGEPFRSSVGFEVQPLLKGVGILHDHLHAIRTESFNRGALPKGPPERSGSRACQWSFRCYLCTTCRHSESLKRLLNRMGKSKDSL